MVLPAPLRPTIATIWPARTRERHAAQRVAAVAVVVAEHDVRIRSRRGTAAAARRSGRSRHLGVHVEQLEDALRRRHRLLQVGVDARQLLDRPVHQQQRRDERRELAGGQIARARSRGCRTTARRRSRRRRETPSAAAAATARASPSGWCGTASHDARSNFAASRPSAPNALTMRWPVKASPATCDMCSCASWLQRVTVRTRLPKRTSG